MSRKFSVRYSAIAGTQAGLGRTASGRSCIADRPQGIAGGEGLGFNGAELLAASLGGCFWNDLHYAAAEVTATLSINRVEAWVDVAGEPGRIVRAHIAAHLTGEGDVADLVFQSAQENSTIANSLQLAFPIVFERL